MKRKSPEAQLAALAWVSSDERLGQLFGKHRMQFSRWRREYEDAPKPRANGDHNVEAWRAWFGQHPEIKGEAEPSLRDKKTLLEIERLRQQIDRGAFESQVIKSKYLAKDYVTRHNLELGTLLSSTLRTKLEDELPPKLAGMTAPAIRMEMKKVHDEICRLMQEGSAKLT